MVEHTSQPGRHRRSMVWFLLLALPGAVLGKYDDTVFLNNGDRIMGDVKELSRDMLRYKTDSMGTVYIRWDDIASLETEKVLRIELKSGRRVVGSIRRADAPEQLIISTRRDDERHGFDDVLAFVPLKLQRAWIDRIEGSVRLGINGTKGSNTVRYSAGLNGLYRGEDWEVSSRFDTTITDKSDDTTSERINFLTGYRKLTRGRWFWTVIGGYDRNDELGVDDRWSGGGGMGRFFVRNNAVELMLQGGLLASREFRTDRMNDELSGYLGGSIAWFKHRFPKTDIRADAFFLPSLTDSGRVRTNWDISVAREIIEDLAFDLTLYYTTDNKAPDESSSDDWGVETSLEYKF